MKILLENLLIIYSVHDGHLKILLEKKQDEPYKGYWHLPNTEINDTIYNSSKRLFEKITSMNTDTVFPGLVFNDISDSQNITQITNIIITDKELVDIKKSHDTEWFDCEQLPKLCYNHEQIILENTLDIKKKVKCNYNDILLDLFPSDFTLSEFQKFYENMLDVKIDRRNFRKKILNQDLVIDTGEKTTNGMGRPGKLYRFNLDKMRGIIL